MDGALLYRVVEAARLLRLSRATVYKLIAEGRLRPAKIGRSTRIPAAELERFVREVTGEPDATPARRRW
jgi:excisionase family DNA binding protein